MNNLLDGELIAMAKGGDEESLTVFLNRHRNALRKYLAAESGNWGAAKDITQDTEIEFWQDFRSIKNNESARTYLFRIGYRNFLDWQRKESRRRKLAEMVPILNEDEMGKWDGVAEEQLSDGIDMADLIHRKIDAERIVDEA